MTAEKAFDGTKTLISELSVYSSDGTQLVSSTDSSGNTAYYTYNEAGFLQTVSAGSSSGTAEYDAVGNLLSFSQSVSGLSDGSVMSNSYTYENDKIKTISHNGFTYEFEYDVWGNQTKAKIGNLVLAENTYGTDEHSDRLSSTVFANGQSVSYAYDENDNITAVFYDGNITPRYSYAYDEEGVLLSTTDNKSGLKTLYTERGTEIRKISDNTLVFSSTCDENGNETHNIAGNSITYIYDGEYNSVTGVYTDSISFEKTGTITTENEASDFSTDAEILTNTDWFGRVISKSLSVDVESYNGGYSVDSGISLTYADTDTTASTKVTSLTSFVSTANNTTSNQEYYEYDAIGNITGIYRIEEDEKVYYNKYYYDEANQIIREDNRLGKFTSTYTYDVGGNIVSRKRYSYTEGDITGLNAREVHTYSYEHSLWGDVLTAYNGQPVTYDAMGNITSLEGDTYEWTAGRQLSRIIKGDSGMRIDYFYDDNGQLSSFDMYNEDGTKSGTYQYFWEDTTLIGVRLLEYAVDSNNVENEIELAQLRILYDADGEAMGFLVNDSIPLLYTKNILGDITGVISPESGRLLFGYAYDAYGNYELITENNTVGENIAAVFLQLLNPLTYRGYAFSIAVGASHYLGSRFYSPQLCRFMNADVYADTAQGVVGSNMFAYCNNNPVMFIDPEGTTSITKEEHQPLDIFSYLLAIYYTLYLFVTGTYLEPISISFPISSAKTETKIKTEILTDTVPKVRSGGRYKLAYVKNGKLVKIGVYFSFVTAIEKLGFTGATNSLSQRFIYDTSKSSIAYNSIKQRYNDVSYWGIYAKTQADAKALAVVFGCNNEPEVHIPGYGHYHDSKHVFHIWFGDKITK